MGSHMLFFFFEGETVLHIYCKYPAKSDPSYPPPPFPLWATETTQTHVGKITYKKLVP